MAFYKMLPCSEIKDQLVKNEEAKPESEESGLEDDQLKKDKDPGTSETVVTVTKTKEEKPKKGKGAKVAPAPIHVEEKVDSGGDEPTQIEDITKGKDDTEV